MKILPTILTALAFTTASADHYLPGPTGAWTIRHSGSREACHICHPAPATAPRPRTDLTLTYATPPAPQGVAVTQTTAPRAPRANVRNLEHEYWLIEQQRYMERRQREIQRFKKRKAREEARKETRRFKAEQRRIRKMRRALKVR